MPTPASLVVQDLILSARDHHASFEARRHPDPVLMRALSRYQRTLVPQLLRLRPDAVVSLQTTVLPLADFDAGITVPDFTYPRGVEATLPAVAGLAERHRAVDLVSWGDRHRYTNAAYLRGQVLFLTGTASDWTEYTAIRFHYTPQVDALTATTGAGGTLILPNAAEPCLVTFLAAFMAKRGHADESVGQPNVAGLQAEWEAAEQMFLSESGRHQQAVVGVVRESF
jgi:hypothetical protein